MQPLHRIATLLVVCLIWMGVTSNVAAKHHETTIVIVNLTDSELKLKKIDTDAKWEQKPLDVLTNGATMSCKVYSDKILEGHHLALEYSSSRGGSIWIKINNSWGSGNQGYQENRGVPPLKDSETGAITPLFFNRYGPPEHGDSVACTWILAWQDFNATGTIPAEQINQYLKESKEMLDASDTGK